MIIESTRQATRQELIEEIERLRKELNKEKEKNKKIEEQLRKANEYIRNEMYIDDNPTICGNEEDTITELPISLNLYNEDLRELLELLEERN
jgi:ABC-type Fe3+-citrate transport system substrate-binding protein